MFSFYGAKGSIVHMYPPPKNNKIIEPFAGSAKYSLYYWNRNILLIEKDEVIVRLWKFLQSCSKQDILGLPSPKKGDNLKNFNISYDERILLSFMTTAATSKPQDTPQSFINVDREKERIANDLFKIRHWDIIETSYYNVDNQKATWFIDPPYQYGGEHYRYSNKEISFSHLKEWVKSLKGQVILCENTKATWMEDLKPMVSISGAYKKSTEAIWSNKKTNYDSKQLSMF